MFQSMNVQWRSGWIVDSCRHSIHFSCFEQYLKAHHVNPNAPDEFLFTEIFVEENFTFESLSHRIQMSNVPSNRSCVTLLTLILLRDAEGQRSLDRSDRSVSLGTFQTLCKANQSVHRLESILIRFPTPSFHY